MIEEKELVYICSPLSAPTKAQIRENMSLARFYVKMVASQFRCRAIAPHSFLPEYLDDNIPEELSKAMVVCGSRISRGMLGEIRRAKELRIPVYALVIQENEISLTGFEEKEECHDM